MTRLGQHSGQYFPRRLEHQDGSLGEVGAYAGGKRVGTQLPAGRAAKPEAQFPAAQLQVHPLAPGGGRGGSLPGALPQRIESGPFLLAVKRLPAIENAYSEDDSKYSEHYEQLNHGETGLVALRFSL